MKKSQKRLLLQLLQLLQLKSQRAFLFAKDKFMNFSKALSLVYSKIIIFAPELALQFATY